MQTSILPKLPSMISQLVSTPSVSCVNPEFDMSNRAVCNLLADWLERAGCEIELMTLPGTRDNVNLIARFGSGPVGLALSGHTDTVPFDDTLWSTDPLAGKIVDDRLYGVGSADMKGFLALCADVIAATSANSLNRSILIIGSADEESSMDGARHLRDIDLAMPPYCIVGEPTSLQPVRQHKGTLMERVIVGGKSGHSSDPALGVNAIVGIHEVISLLIKYEQQLRQSFFDDSFHVPYPTLNFGHIQGGDNPNRICGQCSLDFDLRLMPGMTVNKTRADLHAYVKSQMQGSPYSIDFKVLFEGANPLNTQASSPLVLACESHSHIASGSVNFCTEGPFYSELGAETVIIGPGNIDVAHQPDEFLPLNALQPMKNIVNKLIQQFCVNVKTS